MSPKEFVVFVKGFVSACGDNHPSPEQWVTLKSILGEVKEDQGLATYKENFKPNNPYQSNLPDWLKGAGTTQSIPNEGNISITNLKKQQ